MTLAASESSTFTREQFDQLSREGGRFELVNGELVEKPMSTPANWTMSRIARLFGNAVEDNGVGAVFVNSPFYLFKRFRNSNRRPDVCVVAAERMPDPIPMTGDLEFAPDLVVEVISPNDLWNHVEARLHDYMDAGTKQVWLVDPVRRTVRIHRQDGSVTMLDEKSPISAEPVFPQIKMTVADLFPPELPRYDPPRE